MDHYLAINRANWDARAAIHAEGYMVEDLLADPAAISEVVAFDRPRLGDIGGWTPSTSSATSGPTR